MEKTRYRYLDVLRAVLCTAVLCYHLGILRGGYLAVCGFFVLSGYLSANSLSSAGDIRLGRWYASRFRRLYLPLAITAFLTVGVVSLFPDIIWVSLKPETTSVLLGYDNFWQISA
ncbi:MAG: acyltransferase, partial [Eubacteriaceae bacterium]|nr:acyltransferase [Eubacteriaceae bacterium]